MSRIAMKWKYKVKDSTILGKKKAAKAAIFLDLVG